MIRSSFRGEAQRGGETHRAPVAIGDAERRHGSDHRPSGRSEVGGRSRNIAADYFLGLIGPAGRPAHQLQPFLDGSAEYGLFRPRERDARPTRWAFSPAPRERSLPGGVQPVRYGAMPTVAPVLELVGVEGDPLALAGQCVPVAERCRARRRLPADVHRGSQRFCQVRRMRAARLCRLAGGADVLSCCGGEPGGRSGGAAATRPKAFPAGGTWSPWNTPDRPARLCTGLEAPISLDSRSGNPVEVGAPSNGLADTTCANVSRPRQARKLTIAAVHPERQ